MKESSTIMISVDQGVLYILKYNGEIWKTTGIPNRPWERVVEDDSEVISIAAGQGTLFTLELDGDVWKTTTGIPNRPWERIREKNNSIYEIKVNEQGTLFFTKIYHPSH